ncbi:MAG: DNA-directed polymerase specialized sigma subunit, sigma24-like protein [Labilithrix sp.]|nr:DNA-directed polymerase specialized sigma subunit, sigma24-like protein [Labilithrix sp.]
MSRDVLPVLVENHRRFLGFLESKVGSRATAEEILQGAFVKSIEASRAIREEESAVAWFYRVLRNAVVDHHRHRGAEERALARFAAEMPERVEDAPDSLSGPVCACIGDLLGTLRAEDGELLRQVDVDGAAVVTAAADRHITPGAARVRLHRARQALRRRVEETCGTCATHGCRDCTCGARPELGM